MIRRTFASLLFLLLAALPAWAGELVYLNTPQGAERLVAAKLHDQFFAVEPYVESQQNLAFCGPASMAAVLNSMGIPRPPADALGPYPFFTQDNIFTPATEQIKSRARVASRGMVLAEFTEFINHLGVKARRIHADQMDLAQLRAQVQATLANPEARLIVNYSRKPLGQIGTGHISPLSAYDAASDSVLLLDVAKFKYPPVWIPLADLWEAMRTIDPDSGQSRGVVVVEKLPDTAKGN